MIGAIDHRDMMWAVQKETVPAWGARHRASGLAKIASFEDDRRRCGARIVPVSSAHIAPVHIAFVHIAST